jgi:hypothetical protein
MFGRHLLLKPFCRMGWVLCLEMRKDGAIGQKTGGELVAINKVARGRIIHGQVARLWRQMFYCYFLFILHRIS